MRTVQFVVKFYTIFFYNQPDLNMVHLKFKFATVKIAIAYDMILHKPPKSSNATFMCPGNDISVYLLHHTSLPLWATLLAILNTKITKPYIVWNICCDWYFFFCVTFGTSFRIKHDQVKWSQLNETIHASKEIRVWLIFPCFWHIYLYILLTLALSCMMFRYVNWIWHISYLIFMFCKDMSWETLEK